MGVALSKALRVHAHTARGLTGTFRALSSRTERRVCWVLSVSDRVVATVLERLRAVLRAGDVVLHLAGAMGPEVLTAARTWGLSVGALHPMIAVADGHHAPPLDGVYTFEGDPRARSAAGQLVRRVGGVLFNATRVNRARYHGAAALVATGGVAIAQAAEVLLRTAVEPRMPDAVMAHAIGGLLASVAHNVRTVGASRALASPLMRGDTETVGRHLDAMHDAPTSEGLYRAALARVLEVLDATGAVPMEVLAQAREVLAQGQSGVLRVG